MSSLNNVVIGVLLISFFTFVAFFGRIPAFRRTPIGWLHRCIWTYIPNILAEIDKSVTGGKITGSVSRGWNKLLYEKHPIVLFFFLGLVTGGAILFIPATWPYMPWYHRIVVFVLLFLPYLFARLCNITTPDSPHVINHANLKQQLLAYPYDYKLYHPNIECRTCEIPKPARSKHCSLCRMCVARADHHCIWVNNCLGRGNYKYFIALLTSISVLLFYGSYLAWSTLKPEVLQHFQQNPEWHELEWENSTDIVGRFLGFGEWALDIMGTSFLVGGISRGGVGFLMILTSPLPTALLLYHVYLLWTGMTTNESGKWSDWSEDMADGLAYMTEIDRKESLPIASDKEDSWHAHDNVWKHSTWPKRSEQFLVVTGDGQYPRNLQPELQAIVGDAEWRRCYKLKEVDNVYDLGFWENVKYLMTN